MPKPWAKVQIGYMDHPKFTALNANAVALWHEAKDYCERFHTDGLIPRAALKGFKYGGKKSVDFLLKSCGKKPDGSEYSALWSVHEVGFKMHDYLDHNDCREKVLERIDNAEKRRKEDKDRKAAAREAKKVRTLSAVCPQESPADPPHVVREMSASTTATTTATNKEREAAAAPPVTHRATPIIGRRRLEAAWEGPRGLYVTDKQHRHFVELRGGDEKSVRQFYDAVAAAYDDGGPRRSHETGSDMFKFWSARYDEKWPATPVAAAAKDTGVVYQKMPARPVTEAR